MADTVDAPTRSRMMAGIRSENTRPEMELRRALHAAGLRYRLHDRNLPGRPDLVFPRYRAAVFVHGCFWHRHEGCRYATTPNTRKEFWQEKFATNVARDRRNAANLVELGWRVATVWECATKAEPAAQIGQRLAIWLKDETAVQLDIPVSARTTNPSHGCKI